ncbi:MAG TPA: hypothetical protein QF901_08720 [Gammaproteobacteria bacterium]|nr:hypothetical protein [Gammaproteobacteria bacterium]
MFDPEPYQYSVPFRGNAADALNIARTAVLSLGFEILLESDTKLRAEGPGMHSNQQPDLLGASLLEFDVTNSTIKVKATLGGVATMKTFVYLFPPGLVLSLLIVNSLFGESAQPVLYLIVFPWLVIAPLIGRRLERTTTM